MLIAQWIATAIAGLSFWLAMGYTLWRALRPVAWRAEIAAKFEAGGKAPARAASQACALGAHMFARRDEVIKR